ncbi:hypothetical protein [Psychrobacillus soli]|uniref:Uncharacterized protein n=1 Tax=Psychrobacillus soli TaxID=1543965 RepID=A0A544TKY6_9BACI|nr:hypothetical protein [Psychrobacillus soli]TQR18119.1 hypothetical protein FG383_02930 [Psychrobacillus soli]
MQVKHCPKIKRFRELVALVGKLVAFPSVLVAITIQLVAVPANLVSLSQLFQINHRFSLHKAILLRQQELVALADELVAFPCILVAVTAQLVALPANLVSLSHLFQINQCIPLHKVILQRQQEAIVELVALAVELVAFPCILVAVTAQLVAHPANLVSLSQLFQINHLIPLHKAILQRQQEACIELVALADEQVAIPCVLVAVAAQLVAHPANLVSLSQLFQINHRIPLLKVIFLLQQELVALAVELVALPDILVAVTAQLVAQPSNLVSLSQLFQINHHIPLHKAILQRQ